MAIDHQWMDEIKRACAIARKTVSRPKDALIFFESWIDVQVYAVQPGCVHVTLSGDGKLLFNELVEACESLADGEIYFTTPVFGSWAFNFKAK